MHPDWLASTHHFVAGAVLAGVVGIVARRWMTQWWLVAITAIGVTSTAETLVELVEYPGHAGRLHATAYLDTIADLGMTLVGAMVGVLISLGWRWLRQGNDEALDA